MYLYTYTPVLFYCCIIQAHKKGFTYPYYAWIAFDWYPQKWWTRAVFQDDVDCTDEELAAFLDKAITLRRHPTQEDVNATTTTGIVSEPLMTDNPCSCM